MAYCLALPSCVVAVGSSQVCTFDFLCLVSKNEHIRWIIEAISCAWAYVSVRSCVTALRLTGNLSRVFPRLLLNACWDTRQPPSDSEEECMDGKWMNKYTKLKD